MKLETKYTIWIITLFLVVMISFLITEMNMDSMRETNESLIKEMDESSIRYEKIISEMISNYESRYADLCKDYSELEKAYAELEDTYIKDTRGANISTYEISRGDLELLMKCVQAEAGPKNYESQKIVTKVILNRVESPYFPDNIHDVIYEDGQFAVVPNGMLDAQIVTDETRLNVMEVLLYGYDVPKRVQFFHAKNSDVVSDREIYDVVEGTVFTYTSKDM